MVRRILRIGGELNRKASWIHTALQPFNSRLVILGDEIALMLSLEIRSNGQN
jgi:hypothetical protein